MHSKNLLRALFPALILFAILFSASCKKEKFLTTGGQVSFSRDTLMFDTVFTQQGSATRSVLVYNKQKEKINVNIRLGKGGQSPFRLNVNGIAGKAIDNVEIAGNDSAWVFAAVTIDPNNEDNPFVVEDKIIVSLNGQDFSIPIMAYGQNAYYIVDSVLSTQTWLTNRPYVILKNALVEKGETLTIPAGARVYVHRDSRLFVQGTLKINGTKTDSVIFQGDRLDPLVWIGAYIDIPGQWGGLYFFKESYGNEINYAVFKNGGAPTPSPFGEGSILGATIQVDPDTVMNGIPKLKMTNTVVHTSLGYGVLSFNGSIRAENCRITECGGENVMLFEGGNYQFYYCTIGTFGSQYLSHTENISMAVLNYYPISQSEYRSAPLNADIKNCIVYGSLENEIFCDKKGNDPANITLQNCLFRVTDGIPSFVNQSSNKLNEDPQYVDQPKNDYHLKETSPARLSGVVIPGINTDFDEKPRGAQPSIGCYE